MESSDEAELEINLSGMSPRIAGESGRVAVTLARFHCMHYPLRNTSASTYRSKPRDYLDGNVHCDAVAINNRLP